MLQVKSIDIQKLFLYMLNNIEPLVIKDINSMLNLFIFKVLFHTQFQNMSFKVSNNAWYFDL